MKTIDHKVLSEYLMKHIDYSFDLKCKTAFLLGTVEPDYNPITYLRGSIHQQTMRGHNYNNARICIKKLIDSLQNSKMNKVRKYFIMGKLIHYIADAFTYPHNRIFKGTLREHRIYEKKLHKYFFEKLQSEKVMNIPATEKGLFQQIKKIHQNYLHDKRDLDSDYSYILSATSIIFQSFTEEENSKISCCNIKIA